MLFQSNEMRNVLTSALVFSLLGAASACGGNDAKSQDSAKANVDVDAGVATAEPPASSEPAPSPTVPEAARPDANATAEQKSAEAKATSEQNVTDECAVAAETFRQSMKKPMDACYQTAKKENPYLSGIAKFVLSFNNKAVMTSVRADPSTLTKKSIECMTAAIKGSKWSDPACKGKSMTLTRPYERAGE